MARARVLFVAALIAMVTTLSAAAQESDGLGQQSDCPGGESECPGEEADGLGSGSVSDCVCPKEGYWNVQNLEGKMDCKGAFVLNRKLKPVKDRGAIFVMKEDCSVVFGAASKKKDEDTLMDRVEGCGFTGVVEGEEEGIEMVIDISWTIDNPEHITGEMSSSQTQMGITCDLYRPFEISWSEVIPADRYPVERAKAEKAVEQLRKQQRKKR